MCAGLVLLKQAARTCVVVTALSAFSMTPGTIRAQSTPDAAASGTMTESRKVAYDSKGRVATEVFENDLDGDGNPDRRTTIKFTYDAKGRLQTKAMEFEDDVRVSDVRRESTSFTHDESGELTTETLQKFDGNQVCGQIISTFSYQDLPNGKRMSTKLSAFDEDFDGETERQEVMTFRYDEQGTLQEEVQEIDWDNDGQVDRTVTTRFDYQGNRLEAKVVQTEDADDQLVERRRVRFSGWQGSTPGVETVEVDRGADGTINERFKVMHTPPGVEVGIGRRVFLALNVLVISALMFRILIRRWRVTQDRPAAGT